MPTSSLSTSYTRETLGASVKTERSLMRTRMKRRDPEDEKQASIVRRDGVIIHITFFIGIKK